MWKVSGRVQGVFFRKYTQLKAQELGLGGWCRNTSDGLSVEGELRGPERAVKEMLQWIENEGSPKSFPENLESSIFSPIKQEMMGNFEVRH
jgi:acylphosphatase